jgi:hypothetical protein
MSFKDKTDFPVGVVVDPLLDTVVASRDGFEFTKRELKAQFERVECADNWKNPINTTVSILSVRERIALEEAVIFFAGCTLTLTDTHDLDESGRKVYKATAVGYYNAVGA